MRGFTLVELLVVIAIITITAGLSIPFVQSFQVSSDLRTNSDIILKTLRRAQQQAAAGQQADSWGVYFNTGNNKMILYKGLNYTSRDSEFDQESDFAQTFSLATDFSDEINFSLYSGDPSVTGLVTITSDNHDSQNISISNLGLIQLDE